MKEAGLTLGALPQGVRSEIDLVSLIIQPEDLVTVILEFYLVKASGSGAEEFEHFSLGEQRPLVSRSEPAAGPVSVDSR